MNKIFCLTLIAAVAIFISPALCQSPDTEEKSLQEQFTDLAENAESYNQFKVITKANIDAFSKALSDSLAMKGELIASLQSQFDDLKLQLGEMSERTAALEVQLNESEKLRQSFSFLGINMHKATYHLLVWSIVGLMAGLVIFAYSGYLKNNRVTVTTKKRLSDLEVEFEMHRKKNHEKQIKMGRELQTERNLVEELRAKLKSRTTTAK
jgi:hypothetical protein